MSAENRESLIASERTTGLSASDQRHFHSLDRKLQIVRDRVVGIARGQPGQYGLIVLGRGGISKSFTIQEELERLHVPYRLLNTHLTPATLFATLAKFPDYIHVLDDVEEVLRDCTSLGVLRSATWPCRKDRSGNEERVVTWSARGKTQEVVFRGAIIVICNRTLASMPELQALATRLTPVHLDMTDEEIAALMRHVAASGYRVGDQMLDADECGEVAEFIITESMRLGQRLNLRMLVHGFADRMQADDCASGLPWQDLVASRIAEQPSIVGQVEPVGIRRRRLDDELAVVRDIMTLEPQERLLAWKKATGKSQAAMYRRLAQVGNADAAQFEE